MNPRTSEAHPPGTGRARPQAGPHVRAAAEDEPAPGTSPLDDLKGALPHARDLVRTIEERLRLEVERLRLKSTEARRRLMLRAWIAVLGATITAVAGVFVVAGLVSLLALLLPTPGLAGLIVGAALLLAAFLGIRFSHRRADRADLERLQRKYARQETHEDRRHERVRKDLEEAS